jgi:hypothetical protein
MPSTRLLRADPPTPRGSTHGHAQTTELPLAEQSAPAFGPDVELRPVGITEEMAAPRVRP